MVRFDMRQFWKKNIKHAWTIAPKKGEFYLVSETLNLTTEISFLLLIIPHKP